MWETRLAVKPRLKCVAGLGLQSLPSQVSYEEAVAQVAIPDLVGAGLIPAVIDRFCQHFGWFGANPQGEQSLDPGK